MTEQILTSHRDIWEKKPILKLLYTSWYKQIVEKMVPGRTLEIGGGSGNLKEFVPDVVCSDIVHVPWLDITADAQNLPFSPHSFSNIVLFDVLHHIENPVLFFEEAIRVIEPGGRIVIMDPYVSWASWPIYHFLHPEPVDFSQNPLEVQAPDKNRKPFDSNQAISSMLFEKMRPAFSRCFPSLKVQYKRYLSFFVYPLSGGFDHPSLIPVSCVPALLRFERLLEPLGRIFAFRMLVVLEVGQEEMKTAT